MTAPFPTLSLLHWSGTASDEAYARAILADVNAGMAERTEAAVRLHGGPHAEMPDGTTKCKGE